MTTPIDTIASKKKVLIIGGTSGIGLEVAHSFSKDHETFIVGRNIQKINNDPLLNKANKLAFDISDEKQRQELLEEIKNYGISKIVHCAGIFKTDNQDIENYQKEYKDVKLGGIDIIRKMIKESSEKITHVCVISSLYTFLPDSFVPIFEKRIQQEVEKEVMKLEGVIANCVAPGLTRTPLVERAYGEDGIKKLLEYAPGSRIVEPTEVAQEIYNLSNQSEINKQTIPVDGEYLKFFKFNEFKENDEFGMMKVK